MLTRRTVLIGLLGVGVAGVAGALALRDSGAPGGSPNGGVANGGPWAQVTIRVDGMY